MKVSRDRLILSLLIFCSVPVLGGGAIVTESLPVLAQTQSVDDRKAEADQLREEAIKLRRKGQNQAALEKFQQALGIYRQISEQASEGTTLIGIGAVYNNLGQYPKALEFYQQALGLIRAVGNKVGEGVTLNNIGLVYNNLGQYPRALEFYQQALSIARAVGDKAGEGSTLNNIGAVYDNLGQYPRALEFYQQALGIVREVGNKAGEGSTLSNIGLALTVQKQPELAIVFYKASVNVQETIWQDLKKLTVAEQQTYTETVADSYRTLADLLLKQDRALHNRNMK